MKTAAALFPLLALLLFLPTAVVLYRRHGTMSQWRALSLLGFLYYAITALCMTLVPLPARTANMCKTFAAVAHPQWLPGNTFGDIWKEAHHKVTLNALLLHNPAVSGAVLNLALLLPLGVFVRYHLRRGIAAAAVAGFGASLFFEVTQVTGLWGIYPCPYRLFDVDDLLLNTTGALLGWYVAGPLTRLLPTRESLGDTTPARRTVTPGRRLVALLVDLTGVSAVTVLVALVAAGDMYGASRPVPQVMVAVFAVWFVVLPWLTGTTPGKRLLLLKLAPAGGDGRPALWRAGVRASLLGVVTLPLMATLVAASMVLLYGPSWVVHRVQNATAADARAIQWKLIDQFPQVLLIALVAVLLGGYVLMTWRRRPDLWVHERASGVRTVALTHTRTGSGPHAEPEHRTALPQSTHALYAHEGYEPQFFRAPDAPQAPGPGADATQTPAPEPAPTVSEHH
ncbi:VanZ family protein [Streptomyces kunmingensis]|uniref:VanZ family protein n=1 Tax=Streptomyces kunmingensis TaxID=68225 RepID=A0ABU6C215_9ACTN|nr:VanZ family protein [Streptomyces kunmingensis]MEB3958747.1 VanZ family protein [Streptomyces kunmingensis]